MQRIQWLISAGLRIAVLLILYVAVRLTWSVRLHGLEHVHQARSTYFAITHKRDFDSMAPVPPVLIRLGWRAVLGDVRFAMRSDSFTQGFLARVMRRPSWLVRLMRPLSVRGVVRALGVMPLQKVNLCPLEEWMRDCREVAGDAIAARVLAPVVITQLAAAGRKDADKVASTRLSRLFRWRYHAVLMRYVGPEALIGAARRATQRVVADRARRYLADISAWMRRGGSVYSAPEGQFSPDGHLSRITSGFHRVLRDAPSEARVVPIAIMYDFMTTGRARMFIDIAPAIEHAPALSRDTLNARLRQEWLRAARYTCTQLASGYLAMAHLERRPTIDQADLTATVMHQARNLRSAGRSVDERLLTRRGARVRVRHYLAYAARAGYVARGSGTWTLRPFSLDMEVPPGEAGYRTAPLAYAWNELQDLGIPGADSSATPDDALTA